MSISNMLSKLLKKEVEDKTSNDAIIYKDFDSIIPPPEPKTVGILVYKTLDLEPKNLSNNRASDTNLDAQKTDEGELVLTEVFDSDE